MALDRDPSASTRRILIRAVLLLLPLLAAAAGAPVFLRHLRGAPVEAPPRERPPTEEELAASVRAHRELARTERRTWEGATYLAPADARRDDSGEVTSRFEGFGISVETEPAGARVVVDGADLGETPLVAAVNCTPGEVVRVVVERPPLRPVERTTTCRENTLVELSAKLSR
jgi:hypothetical protein